MWDLKVAETRWSRHLGNYPAGRRAVTLSVEITMAAPAQQSPLTGHKESRTQRPEPAMDDMLRECIELCARVAEKHGASEAAQHIRALKPASRWP